MIEIYLSQAGRHFSAVGSSSRDQYQIFGQWDMIVMTKSIFTEDCLSIMRIAVDLISFPDPILFSLEILFKFEDDIKHIPDIDIIDHDMWFDSDIFFDISDELIDVVFIVDIFVAELSIGKDIYSIYAEHYLCIIFEREENIFFGLRIKTR